VRKIFELGGVFAAVVLIVFGAVSIFMGVDGRSTVDSSLKQEQIVGTPDMTPALIKAEAQKAGLPIAKITFPTQSVAGKTIDSGSRARVFAEYMRIHNRNRHAAGRSRLRDPGTGWRAAQLGVVPRARPALERRRAPQGAPRSLTLTDRKTAWMGRPVWAAHRRFRL
jgi:hypothetical protein